MSRRGGRAAPSRPVARWIVLAGLLTGLFAALGVSGLLAAGRSDRALGPGALPPGGTAGPVLEVVDGEVRSSPGAAGLVGIALVDPGPGATRSARAWADAVDVLARHGATATWFVSGRVVLDRGGHVARARAAGGELGVTGFTGRDLATRAPWQQRVELSAAQAALASRIGVTSPLLLLPASPTPDTFDAAAVSTARVATAEGYAVVVGSAPELTGPGGVAVVPLDAQAGARLDALLTRSSAAGVRATTVAEVAGSDRAATNPTADAGTRWSGSVLTSAVTASGWVAYGLDLLFRPLAVLVVIRAAIAVVLARRHARRAPPNPAWAGPVTVVVPAYNEAAGIETALRSLVSSWWPYGLAVVVVDDGSTDATADIVAGLRLRGVSLVRQPNRGKAAALNTGIALARTDVVVMVDGDTVFEPGTIAALVAPFSDARIGATSGNAKVLNRRSLLGRWQHVEYVMGFNLDRRLLASVGAIATVPGAVGAFRTDALRDVGGVSEDTLAEDTDLTIAVQRAGWRVAYQDEAVAWTEAPATIADLWRQRYRWCYGTLQAVWKHRRAVVERHLIGPVGLPYALVFQVLVALLGPIVDVVALYGILTGNTASVAVTWLAFALAQMVLAAWAFRLDGESLRPLWTVPLQQIAYRQLMYLVVIQSVAAAVAGTRLRWHKLRRLGLAGAPVGVARVPVDRWRAPQGPRAARR